MEHGSPATSPPRRSSWVFSVARVLRGAHFLCGGVLVAEVDADMKSHEISRFFVYSLTFAEHVRVISCAVLTIFCFFSGRGRSPS